MYINYYSRLHLLLISMFKDGYRVNGGLGFSINLPSGRVKFYKSKQVKLVNETLFEFDSSRVVSIIETTRERLNLQFGVKLEVSNIIPINRGFGSGTSIKLACLEALFIVNNEPYDSKTLIELSGRGGTSGIGVHSYFTGGFIFDLGHKSCTTSTLKPSHAVNTASRPLLLSREEMPKWPIGICIPNDINPLTHIEERQFFNDICPLKREAVYETAYHALFGVFASVKAKDYDTFCLAIKNIQNCEWKKAERNVYGKRLKDYENLLYSSGADAVGMSSLGPSLYFMAKNPKLIIDKLNDLPCQFYNAEMVNHGRILNNV